MTRHEQEMLYEDDHVFWAEVQQNMNAEGRKYRGKKKGGQPSFVTQPRITHTSENNPINLDVIRLPPGVSGRLFITFAPGKCGPALNGDLHARDLKADLKRLDELDVDVLVNLMEAEERARYGIPALEAECFAANIALLLCPVPDMSVPQGLRELNAYTRTVQQAARDLRFGRWVAVTCRGGRGRAGTFAACVLVELGLSGADAMQTTRAGRKGAIENRVQEQFVLNYAGHRA